MDRAISGGCLCGAVRFSTNQAPVAQRACWCRTCQKLACGNASINIIVPTEGMTITGALASFVSTADSGNVLRRSFCPVCGAPMFSETEQQPLFRVIRAGVLDDPEMAGPNSAIWTASAPSWAWTPDDLPTCEGQPPPVG
jgi:hypothetical protein